MKPPHHVVCSVARYTDPENAGSHHLLLPPVVEYIVCSALACVVMYLNQTSWLALICELQVHQVSEWS